MDASTRLLLAERMARQGLATRPAASPTAATALTSAIQAQDSAASRLGLRARARGLTEAGVLQVTDADRTLVRTWLMRSTIHLVAAADVRWLVRLIGPSVQRRFANRWRQLGLTAARFDRICAALCEMLAGGPLSRQEIRAGFAARGIRFDATVDPNVHWHVLVYASVTGLICRGPDRGRINTFVLLDQWLPGAPRGPDGDAALADLARRYFAAFAPATAADFTAWSGLPSSRAIELIRAELTAVDVAGRPGFRLGEVEPQQGVRLLPAFDNYLIGYRHRDALLHPDLHPHVYQGGMIRPVVVRDGAVIGTWALDRRGRRVTVVPLTRWPAPVRRAVADEVVDVAAFLDTDLALDAPAE